MCDYGLKVEVGRLFGVGFMGYFAMRSLKMQLRLFKYVLADWLGYVFYMMRIMFGGGVISLNRYRDLLPIPGMKRETVCIVRKDEKQIQILDGY
jgi:hypothetical protein